MFAYLVSKSSYDIVSIADCQRTRLELAQSRGEIVIYERRDIRHNPLAEKTLTDTAQPFWWLFIQDVGYSFSPQENECREMSPEKVFGKLFGPDLTLLDLAPIRAQMDPITIDYYRDVFDIKAAPTTVLPASQLSFWQLAQLISGINPLFVPVQVGIQFVVKEEIFPTLYGLIKYTEGFPCLLHLCHNLSELGSRPEPANFHRIRFNRLYNTLPLFLVPASA